MHILCLMGKHKFDQHLDHDRISPMGNPSPKFLRCRSAGGEGIPIYKERPDAPMA